MKVILSVLVLMTAALSAQSAQANHDQCRMDLKNGRGMILDSFVGYGYTKWQACSEAKRDCMRAIRAGYHRARYLYCEEARRSRRPMVQRSCQARLEGRHGRTVQTFLGRASGPKGTGVKRQACDRALRQCETFRSRRNHRGYGHGRYGHGRCVIDRRGHGRHW